MEYGKGTGEREDNNAAKFEIEKEKNAFPLLWDAGKHEGERKA